MAASRVGYLFALLGAGVFSIFFEGWFSAYLLLLLLVLPFFSLLVSLPGMLSCRLELIPSARRVRRGEQGELYVILKSRLARPVGRLTVRVTVKNLLTGEKSVRRCRLTGGALRTGLGESLPTGHCGEILCEADRPRICDLLGLFSLRGRRPPAAELTVLPLERPEEPVAPPDREAAGGLRVRPGGGPGEDYDLRPYRPGDLMRSVHWKLSAKTDDLVVRETLERRQTVRVLTYDHFGPPDRLDQVFDRLEAISRALLSREEEHYIAFEREGELLLCLVTSPRSLESFQWTAFSTPAPAQGQSLAGRRLRLEGSDALVRQYHVLPLPREGEEGEK